MTHDKLDNGARPFPHAKKTPAQQEIDLFLLEHSGPGPRLIYYLANWLTRRPDPQPKPDQSKQSFPQPRKAR